MEKTSNKVFNSTEYTWYWKANKDPFDESLEPSWSPYYIWISNFIEERFLKKITPFDIEIGTDIYSIDFKR